ncbi:MAG: carbamoyltransferase family protein, partial [Rhizomicrobium sp.]
MIILGLNAFHGDAAAALLRDGKLIAAAEEERFRRIKHWAGFPSQAIRYCLLEAGVSIRDVDHIAVNQDSRANLWRKIRHVAAHPPRAGLVLERMRNRKRRVQLPNLVASLEGGQRFVGKFHRVEHHLSHLYSAFYVSPFRQAAVLSVDGFGDFSSAAWGAGDGDRLTVHRRIHFPHSLGIFYQALTQYLGFPHYGDEYKVMGLAPYGEPSYLDKMRQILRLCPKGEFELNLRYFRHHVEEIPHQWMGGSPQMADLFRPALEDLLGPRRRAGDPIEDRHRHLARSTQAMYEEGFFNILQQLQKDTGFCELALAGGCAANSVANGKVRRRSGFRRVYVQSAAGDAGGAIGAALSVWNGLKGTRSFVMNHAYWGPGYTGDELAQTLARRQDALDKATCTTEALPDDFTLCKRTAAAIAAGKVVGWFQGRMEWGPRALGNRSILGDPRRADMKAVLNSKIKRRESFRPFAPSVLDSEVAEWFEDDDAVPFMMQVYQVREGKRALIPAVTHVDGSGRLQTVSRDANPVFFALIEAFRELTAVPMLLNTSFNENEPLVCTPDEALDCFVRTRMDVLVLGRLY